MVPSPPAIHCLFSSSVITKHQMVGSKTRRFKVSANGYYPQGSTNTCRLGDAPVLITGIITLQTYYYVHRVVNQPKPSSKISNYSH